MAAVFTDDVSGGGDFMKRPGMVALLRYLETHADEPHVVIFDDLKRYARDTVFHLKLRQEMTLRNATRECLNFNFEDSPEGEFIETIIAAQSQLERQQNSRQVRQKMRARVMNGYWVFRAPIGYRHEKREGHGKVLVPDEPNASIVREALEGYATGRFASQIEVKRYLDRFPDFGHQTDEGIRIQRVREMLECPVYAGYVHAPGWDIGLRKGQHEPLVSFETHQRVLERLRGKTQAAFRKDTRQDFPLRGIVTCACCDRPMTAAFSKGRHARYGYYFCQTKGCEQGRKSIRRERIEEEFEALLESLRADEALARGFHEIVAEVWESGRAGQAEQHKLLKAELVQIERKSAALMERLIAAESSVLIAAYEQEVRKLQERRIAVQEKLSNKPEQMVDFRTGYRTALSFIANPGKLWASEHLTLRRTVPKLLFGGRLPYHRIEGYRTADIAYPFKALQGIKHGKYGLVRLAGLEPALRLRRIFII
ncbi:MAG: recombinase family protein [Alphaproteobacteria bacterium]|nr:recombinase family protein [Alphaproteobacteria bacterium]